MTVSYNKLKMLFFDSSKSNSVYVKFREIKGGIIKNGKIYLVNIAYTSRIIRNDSIANIYIETSGKL